MNPSTHSSTQSITHPLNQNGIGSQVEPPPLPGFLGADSADPLPGFLGIKGQAYGLEVLADGWRLTSPRGEVYDVVPCHDLAIACRGLHCSCPDHRYRHAGLPSRGCKHIQAILQSGIFREPE